MSTSAETSGEMTGAAQALWEQNRAMYGDMDVNRVLAEQQLRKEIEERNRLAKQAEAEIADEIAKASAVSLPGVLACVTAPELFDTPDLGDRDGKPITENAGERFKRERAAKNLCKKCNLLDQCLANALSDDSSTGIRGGTTEDERKRLRQLHQIRSSR